MSTFFSWQQLDLNCLQGVSRSTCPRNPLTILLSKLYLSQQQLGPTCSQPLGNGFPPLVAAMTLYLGTKDIDVWCTTLVTTSAGDNPTLIWLSRADIHETFTCLSSDGESSCDTYMRGGVGGIRNMLEAESPRADSHVSLADKLVFGKIDRPLCTRIDHLLQPLPPNPGM